MRLPSSCLESFLSQRGFYSTRCRLRAITRGFTNNGTSGNEVPAKTTTSSSSRPTSSGLRGKNADEGFLAFTKTSLYKLTLPLASSPSSASHNIPSSSSASFGDKESDTNIHRKTSAEVEIDEDSKGDGEKAWEQRVEDGERPVARSRHSSGSHSDWKDVHARKIHSVVFLLHSGQPLSYISSLIRAEEPETTHEPFTSNADVNATNSKSRRNADDPTGDPPITFHLHPDDGQRWSPATGIGDFVREAARASSFAILIGERRVVVRVPSFEERTRFLRSRLHSTTREIERLAKVKDACDRQARVVTRRTAFGGAGMMGIWWVTVGYLTFHTDLGWDTMEPITYLTGLGTVISGYIWFLWHNREVSYRTVLTEQTSRRQHKLYQERGFDTERYQELIEDAKELRRDIKRVAWDYDLTWDQGDTESGRKSKRALQIVRREEMREKRRNGVEEDEEDEEEEEVERSEVDNDGDGRPDGKGKG